MATAPYRADGQYDTEDQQQNSTSSLLILARGDQNDDPIEKLHHNLDASLRYTSAAQGIEALPTKIFDISQSDKDCITKILAASGTIPVGSALELGGILLYSTPPPKADSSKHTLLSLPPEMRNRIYRFALLEAQTIVVDTDWEARRPRQLPKEPPLLSSCRQIRKEALGIYYQENHFTVIIRDLDADSYLQACGSSNVFFESNHTYQLLGGVNWWNFERWLMAYYHGECSAYEAKDDSGRFDAGAHLFRIVSNMRDECGCDWDEIEMILDNTRAALAVHDSAWGDGLENHDDW